LPEAQQTMQKALLLAPKDAVVNVDYAVHLFRDRLYAEAQKYIDKALFYDPGNWQALWCGFSRYGPLVSVMGHPSMLVKRSEATKFS
jgi:predicted Zn-dependent protease